MAALAGAVQAVGLNNAPRVLAAAAERAAHANAPAAAPTPIVKAQELLFAQPPEEVVPPRIPMERVPGQSGKEAASDIPSYARGTPRYVEETPEQYARRVMDDRWGKGNWERIRIGRKTSEKSRSGVPEPIAIREPPLPESRMRIPPSQSRNPANV